MPATTKNKRKIHVNGCDFYWTTRVNSDYISTYVSIMTLDKRFYASYKVIKTVDQQNQFKGRIVITNANIPELSDIPNGLQMESPAWTDVYEWVSPQHVRKIIVHIFETLM